MGILFHPFHTIYVLISSHFQPELIPGPLGSKPILVPLSHFGSRGLWLEFLAGLNDLSVSPRIPNTGLPRQFGDFFLATTAEIQRFSSLQVTAEDSRYLYQLMCRLSSISSPLLQFAVMELLQDLLFLVSTVASDLLLQVLLLY